LSRTCRSCGDQLEVVLDLGLTPLANSLLREDQLEQPEPRFPLRLAICRGCALAQLMETVPPEDVFTDYPYFSSFSDTMVRSVGELVGRLVRSRALGPESLALEVASNDGYLLRHYLGAGVPVLGIDPARNIAVAAQEAGIPTMCEFFGRELGRQLRSEGRLADVLHANNVVAHVPDLNGLFAGFEAVLKPGGLLVIEVPHVLEMVERLEFDTIYHEHVFYFSLSALQPVFERHGLHIVEVERLPVHGGSLRIFGARENEPSAAVARLLEQEKSAGVNGPGFYTDFNARVNDLGTRLVELLDRLRRDGDRIAAYGASAKGSTLLNYFGIGRETIEFVADRSTVKHGLYTPGTHLPILPPDALRERMPDSVLLLTWNFADEILEQQREYRERGGRFILPVPEPRLL
jgi:SAM-dependent methyltransferase